MEKNIVLPLISVVLPVYNVSEYLPKCMASIFAQDYPKLDIILVDDGSTDGICPGMCDEYASGPVPEGMTVRAFHKANGGLSDARNYGICRAEGEYITLIDSDDFVDKDYVSYMWSLLNGAAPCKMAISAVRVLSAGGKTLDPGHAGTDILDGKTCIKRMLYHDEIDTSACAKLYKKSLFDGVEYPVGKNFEDIGTTYKLFMLCERVAAGYESKYNYITRSTSIVNEAFNLKKLDLLEMTDKMAVEVTEAWPDLKQAALRRQVYARFSTLNQMLGVKSPEFVSIRGDIIDYIKTNSKAVLKDANTPKRDRMAIYALKCGFPIYRLFWGIYLKIKKG